MRPAARKAKRIAAENAVIMEHAKGGRDLKDLVTETGYCLRQLTRIKADLMGGFVDQTKSELQIWRDDQLARIEEAWDSIESDMLMTGAEKHMAWARWMKLEMDLRGTAAPSRSESVNLTVNAENLERFRLTLGASEGMNEMQFQAWLQLGREVQRVVRALPEPPETSPLWGDQKKLGDGDAT
jgi:hypothetical protein